MRSVHSAGALTAFYELGFKPDYFDFVFGSSAGACNGAYFLSGQTDMYWDMWSKTLLSKDFLKLVIIAAVIAFPVAWWAMNKWLQDFAYRINIPWWIFLLAGIVAALVALITISFQAIKAAVANPVKNLRTE